MNKNHLLSYAIMTVNDSANIDYYDNLSPFVKEALRVSGKEIISANDLKSDIKKMFDLEIPINVVNTILKKRLLKAGYITYSDRKYIPNYEKLEETNFSLLRDRMLEKHERLISEFIIYAREKYEFTLSKEDAETKLQAFIAKHYLQLLGDEKSKGVNFSENENHDEAEIILANFIILSNQEKSINFDYLIEIVKGTMLANSLYYTELDSIEMKFKSTEVYFDSTFIIYALGLAGEAKKEPCTELITMLRESKAILRIFKHNVEEICGILEGCKNNLASGKIDFHGTVSNFLDKGYIPSDIDRIIYGLENEIEDKLKIKVQENASFAEHKYVISESDLTEHLRQSIKYTRQAALDRDVQSVSAIMRLRKGRKTLKIENSQAVFVTTNYSLVDNVSSFFLDQEMPRYIPPVLHDSVITNLVWLKMPNKVPNLPVKRIIAECYAAISPKEHLWKRYLETLKIYEDTNELTKEDLIQLRYTQGARELLVDKTLGNEDAITIGTVKEILSAIENENTERLREAGRIAEIEKIELKKMLEDANRETAAVKEESKNRIDGIARKRANIGTALLALPICGVISIFVYFISKINEVAISNWLLKVFVIGLAVLPTILGLINVNLLPFFRGINKRLYNRIEKALLKKYYPDINN